MPVVWAGIHTLHHKAKEIADRESPELPCESTGQQDVWKNIRNVPYVTKWIIQNESSAGKKKTWYIDSKGHFEYVCRYEQLTLERN